MKFGVLSMDNGYIWTPEASHSIVTRELERMVSLDHVTLRDSVTRDSWP